MSESTTIQVSRELKDFLATQATHKGETYEQIIKRLLEQVWKVKLAS